MHRLANAFRLKELPVVASLAIAGATWTLTRIVDDFAGAPTVEYSTRTTQLTPTSVKQTVTIRNISTTKVFRSFTVIVQLPTGSKNVLSDPQCEPEAPARVSFTDEHENTGKIAAYPIMQLHPEWTYHLTVIESNPGTIDPVEVSFLSPDPSGPIGSTKQEAGAIRLIHSSIETWMVRHEVALLCTMMLLWSTVIGLFFYHATSNEERATSEE